MSKHEEHKDERPALRLIPAVDVYEKKEEVVLVADLPGVTEKGLEVTLDMDQLTISGKTVEGNYESYAYERTFTLSDRVDKSGIKASVKDGVLTLAVPYAEEAKTKKIPVTYN